MPLIQACYSSKLISILVTNEFFLQSEEDLALKQQLELYVERAQDAEEGIQRAALEAMRY